MTLERNPTIHAAAKPWSGREPDHALSYAVLDPFGNKITTRMFCDHFETGARPAARTSAVTSNNWPPGEPPLSMSGDLLRRTRAIPTSGPELPPGSYPK